MIMSIGLHVAQCLVALRLLWLTYCRKNTLQWVLLYWTLAALCAMAQIAWL